MRAASVSSSIDSSRAPKRCIADAAACVDARPEHEAQMVGRGRNRQRSGIAERLETDVAALAHGLQALGDVGAVQTLERNDVAHGCQPNEIEQTPAGRVACADPV